MEPVYRSLRPDGEDAETHRDQPNIQQSRDDDTPTISSGLADSAGERHEAPPTTDIRDRLVTPATARHNSTGQPVPLHLALATWSDGSMASHTRVVREKAQRFADVRSTCTDHPDDRKTCPNCKQAKSALDSAKRRGGGHLYTGHFVFRHRYGLVALSEVVPIDFDGMDEPEKDRDRLATLTYCVGSRVSVSGTGVHALVYADSIPEWDGHWPPQEFVAASRIIDRTARTAAYQCAAEAHPQWVQRIDELSAAYSRAWHRAVNQVRIDLGMLATADEKAKDLGRLLYDCHDDDAKINLCPCPLPAPPETEGTPPPDLVNAALHALKTIHPPADASQWMRLVYHCKAIGVPEQDVDAWSRKGDRYEKGELEHGQFLCYQTLQPKETAEEALHSLQADAANQDPTFVPLKTTEEFVADSGSTGGPRAQCPENETRASDEGRIPIFAGQELAAEARRVVDAIISSNRPVTIFSDVTNTFTLELVGEEVRPVPKDGIAILMDDACKFLIWQKDVPKPKYSPERLTGTVNILLPRRLPKLNGVKRSPFFYDGQLVTLVDQFHSPSGYYCRIPADIDVDLDTAECLRRLEDLFGEFPYAQDADLANCYGLLVGQPLKVLYVSPIAFFDKPASQTGATLLARTIATLADGREPKIMTASERPEETDKRVIACLNARPSSMVIDNISFRLGSDIIASGMTAEEIGGRLLGGNSDVKVPTKSLQIYMNGNNAAMERDLINRAISVRLDSGMETPEERAGFRHVLPRAALERRSYYLSAVVSLIQRWIDAGCPDGPGPVLDTYGDWMRAVGGILEVAGVKGFNLNRSDFKIRADTGGIAERRFVEAWLASGGLTDRSLEDLLSLGEGLFELKGEGDKGRAQSLGHQLRKMLDKTYLVGKVKYFVRRDRGSRSSYSLRVRPEIRNDRNDRNV